jgi:plasmid stabilization system protein ParE
VDPVLDYECRHKIKEGEVCDPQDRYRVFLREHAPHVLQHIETYYHNARNPEQARIYKDRLIRQMAETYGIDHGNNIMVPVARRPPRARQYRPSFRRRVARGFEGWMMWLVSLPALLGFTIFMITSLGAIVLAIALLVMVTSYLF